jgi:hypothetical protein
MRVARTGTENLSARHLCNRESASDFVREIVKLVGDKRAGRVILIGCEHIELLIQLAQHGFLDVTCCKGLAGPNAGEMSADIVIAPAADREPQFPAVLSRLTHGLQPDAILILGTAGALIMTRVKHIQALLIQRGFAFTRMHLEPAGVDLWCCRKVPASQAHAA